MIIKFLVSWGLMNQLSCGFIEFKRLICFFQDLKKLLFRSAIVKNRLDSKTPHQNRFLAWKNMRACGKVENLQGIKGQRSNKEIRKGIINRLSF